MSLELSSISPARREHYRELLHSRARALLDHVHSELRQGRESERPDIGDQVDEASRLDQMGLSANLGAAEAARLREVQEAAVRLSHGTYGICEDCGDPIDPARLELIPEARRCAPDQERYEQTRAQERAAQD